MQVIKLLEGLLGPNEATNQSTIKACLLHLSLA